MSNVPLMFQPLVKYADFQGRSRRSEFWLWILFRILLGMGIGTLIACLIVPALVTLHDKSDVAEVQALVFTRIFPFVSLIGLINLGLLIPTIAVAVRRLHDTGRTGWWVILPHAVAIIGVIAFAVMFVPSVIDHIARDERAPLSDAEHIQFVFRTIGSAALTVYLPTFIAAVVLIVFYLTDGKTGPNRFGPDPKGRGEPAPSALMSPADAPEEMH